MKINLFMALVVGFLVGCAPSHSVWERGLDSFVGTPFDSHIYEDCSAGCGDSYWSPVNDRKVFDEIAEDLDGKRYYMTWIRGCRYSVLVSVRGIIKSWRYEVSDVSDCYVF